MMLASFLSLRSGTEAIVTVCGFSLGRFGTFSNAGPSDPTLLAHGDLR